jgi:hypothetical protein
LLLNKGLFSDRVTTVQFAPDLRLIPYGVTIEDYPPYHVYNLDRRDFQSGIKLTKPLKTSRLVAAGLFIGIVLIASFSAFIFLKNFLKKPSKTLYSVKNPKTKI